MTIATLKFTVLLSRTGEFRTFSTMVGLETVYILFNAHHHIELVYMHAKMPLTNIGKWTVLYTVVAVETALIFGTWRLWDNLNRRPGS